MSYIDCGKRYGLASWFCKSEVWSRQPIMTFIEFILAFGIRYTSRFCQSSFTNTLFERSLACYRKRDCYDLSSFCGFFVLLACVILLPKSNPFLGFSCCNFLVIHYILVHRVIKIFKWILMSKGIGSLLYYFRE